MISDYKFGFLTLFFLGFLTASPSGFAERKLDFYEKLGVEDCQELLELGDLELENLSWEAVHSPIKYLEDNEERIEYYHSIYLIMKYPKSPVVAREIIIISLDSFKNCDFWDRLNGKTSSEIIAVGKSINQELLNGKIDVLRKNIEIIRRITPPGDTNEDVERKVSNLQKMIDDLESTPFIPNPERSRYFKLLKELRYIK